MTAPSPERQPADAGIEAILDCPFCGDAAHLDYDTETEMFGVEAEHARGCILKNWDFRFYVDEHAALNAWNRRSPAPQAQPDARAVEGEPVAWRVRRLTDDPEEWQLRPAGAALDFGNPKRWEIQPLYLSAPDDGWRPSREEVARVIGKLRWHPNPWADDYAAADAILALHPAAPTEYCPFCEYEEGNPRTHVCGAAPTDEVGK